MTLKLELAQKYEEKLETIMGHDDTVKDRIEMKLETHAMELIIQAESELKASALSEEDLPENMSEVLDE